MRAQAAILLGTVLLGATTAPETAPRSQDPTPQVPVETSQDAKPAADRRLPAPNHFLDGWMSELLFADHKAARKHYTAAIEETGLPDYQSELAMLRLWESSWKPADRRKYRSGLEGKNLVMKAGVSPRFIARIEVDAFAAAIDQANENQLERLRERLEVLAKGSNPLVRDPRPIVASHLVDFRGDSVQVDSELEALKRQRKVAVDAGDHTRAHEIWVQMWRHQSARRRQASSRVRSNRWAAITHHHLRGSHQQARGMEQRLRGSRPLRTAEMWMRRIRGWDEATRRERSQSLQEKIAALLQRRSLLPVERKVLDALRSRVGKLIQENNAKEALLLAAQTPYRDRLF